jgi:hypothetical protein
VWWIGARERDQGVPARVRLRSGGGRCGAPGHGQGARDQGNCKKNVPHPPVPLFLTFSVNRLIFAAAVSLAYEGPGRR